MNRLFFITILFVLKTSTPALAHDQQDLALAYMDLQTHITMNYPWGIFFKDPLYLKETPQNLSYKHLLKNVIHPDFLKNNEGARIIINGAMAAERATSKKQATKLILKQINHLNEFALANSSDFVVAKTPEEVRRYLKTTNKTIIIHSIEGGRRLIESQADADFWAKQGVAFITLIHLLDDEYGGAAHNPGDFMTRLINLKGTLTKFFHPHRRRGLTEHGKQSVHWLMNAGLMIDTTHMSPASLDDTMDILETRGLPPLATHSLFGPIQKSDRGISPKQLIRMYQLGGLFSLPISGENLIPHKASPEFLDFIKNEKICEASVDSYRVAFNFVEKTLKENSHLFVNSTASENEQKVSLSIGFQTDFNGWTNHSYPRYGKKGCYPIPNGQELSTLETKGLAHPGQLPEYWELLTKEGMNTESLQFSTEKFLRMWEKFRSN